MTGIVYIHVPKCGGSSFGAALRVRFALSQTTIRLGQGNPLLTGPARILSDYADRQKQLRQLMARGVRMISGHVQYQPELPARGYAFVTLLRDPVDRFVSHYNYLQRKHPDPARAATLQAFLDTSDAARLATQYLFYFAGQDTGDRDTRIDRAIANLGRFDVVGDLNDTDAFVCDLRGLIRGPLPQWRRNAAPARTTVPDHLRPQIETLCAPDIAIYKAVKAHRTAA